MRAIQTSVPGLRFYHNLVPESFHADFVKQLTGALHEQRDGHYDGFSFADDAAFDAVFYPMMHCLFQRMRELRVFRQSSPGKLKLGCSLIGYERNGYIKRHKDSVLLSGNTVAVFSFGSPCVINFYQEDPPRRHEKIFVPSRSLYVMEGEARHRWEHAVLPDEDSFQGNKFHRDKRYSLLLFEPGPLYREEILEC
ncbi:MAG: alpha-ketoglutarate-dependent dioxygenase AlkB [Myxococcota bacterium]